MIGLVRGHDGKNIRNSLFGRLRILDDRQRCAIAVFAALVEREGI